MSAHLRDLPKCYCGFAATHELRNTFNAVLGHYCRKHAKVALNAALEREKEAGIARALATQKFNPLTWQGREFVPVVADEDR